MSEKELIEKDLEEAAQKQEEEQLRNLERYHFLKENGYILFETITGSQAHGTNTPTSDVDKAFIYILPEDDILGTEYKEQLKIHKDFMGYEIRRFLELLKKGNPTILELLHSPEDCVLIKHPAFDILLNQKENFVTKACENAFYGYAKQQRQKAEGLEKLKNWEVNRVTKKGPLDFCYVPIGYDSIPMKTWLEQNGLDQLFCALTAVSHCKDLYAVFYDHEAHEVFSELVPEPIRIAYKAEKKAAGESMGLGYKGIAFEESNDIRLSNIPIEERPKSICHLSYNKDWYKKHCIDYKRYQTWLEERNENRWVEIKGHGQSIDGKNMMHFMRLVIIGREIAEGKGIRIRRPDAQELLKIRRGEVSLQELFDKSDIILNEMKALFQNSNLPNEVTQQYINNLLIEIRRKFYKQINNKLGFTELTEFRRNLINAEETNPFIVKAYGKFSELHYFISEKITEHVMDGYGGDFGYLYDTISASVIMLGFVHNSNRWPMTRHSDSGKIEKLITESIYILSWTRDKITVQAAAEWQQPIQFDIVIWMDTLVAINVRPIEKFTPNNIVEKEYFKYLGYELPNGNKK